MQISRVIMNASPIICMMKAGITEILPALFRDIVVPDLVKREILVKGSTDLNGLKFPPNKSPVPTYLLLAIPDCNRRQKGAL